MLDRIEFPLTNSQISNFILSKEYTTYFPLQQSLIELKDSDLIAVEKSNHTSYYHITEHGRFSLEAFQGRISSEIKREVDTYLVENKYTLRNEVATRCDYQVIHGGDYQVSCRVLENNQPLIELTLTTPTEEMAISICENWKKQHTTLYQQIIQTLLLTPSEE